MVVKAELHCHIEGAASPALVEAQAEKYGADVSAIIEGDSYVWSDFTSFLHAYDLASRLFRDEDDYALLAETYLADLASQDAIYSEFFISTDHAIAAGLTPEAYISGLAEGMRRAREATGIESRMIATGLRHEGPEGVELHGQVAGQVVLLGGGGWGQEGHLFSSVGGGLLHSGPEIGQVLSATCGRFWG